uniref:Clathrin binding box of aftiphilin containing 1 n=1 Tax=Chelonoidis abingdonii TaxID=106734 RepID=A0A8C0IP21_CHEAB
MQDQQLVESPSTIEALSWMSLKDLTTKVSGMSLSQNNEGIDECNLNESRTKEDTVELEMMHQSLPWGNSRERNCEGFSESIHCISESNSSWGDFKSFSESLVKSESISHTPEVLVNSAETKTSKTDMELYGEHCNTSHGHHCSKPSVHNGREASANLSYEDIFKLSFPEVIVPQSTENIRSLDQVLDTDNEDIGIREFMKRHIDSGNVWRTLRDPHSTTGLRCPRNKSHCQENFLSALGIDVNQKLAVSPDSRHGHFFSYNLFLKRTPSNGNMQFKTVPGKKRIFSTHSLKMKIFNSDVC